MFKTLKGRTHKNPNIKQVKKDCHIQLAEMTEIAVKAEQQNKV